jgi:hypothetical protein
MEATEAFIAILQAAVADAKDAKEAFDAPTGP